jgi:hypothetical protein
MRLQFCLLQKFRKPTRGYAFLLRFGSVVVRPDLGFTHEFYKRGALWATPPSAPYRLVLDTPRRGGLRIELCLQAKQNHYRYPQRTYRFITQEMPP